MKIVIDEGAGVCPGVRRAIEIAEKELIRGTQLVSLGPLIHNRLEVQRLKALGIETMDQATFAKEKVWKGAKLLIRTHGIPKDLLADCELSIIDATCPFVRRSQKLIEKYYRDGYQIVIVGKKSHPEVIGLLGYCDGNARIVLDETDLNGFDFTKQTFLLAQTTVSHHKFLAIKKFFQARTTNLKVQDTTCGVIRNRQQQVRDFARQNGVVLFVGGKDSSNTKELFHICLQENKNTYHIEEGSEIELRWLQGVQSVGITGGASTPRWQLEKVRDSLAKMILGNSSGSLSFRGE